MTGVAPPPTSRRPPGTGGRIRLHRRTVGWTALTLAVVVALGLTTGFLIGLAGNRRGVGPLPTAAPSNAASTATGAAGPTVRADTDVERGRRDDLGYLLSARREPGGLHVRFDRVQLLEGAEAARYAAANGQDLPPSGMVIVNENRRTRTVVLHPEVRVFGGAQLAGSTEPERIPLQTLLRALPRDGRRVPLALRYDPLGYVVEIHEQELP